MEQNQFAGMSHAQAKRLHRSLVSKHHPDRGGDTAIMQRINADYDAYLKSSYHQFEKPQSMADAIIAVAEACLDVGLTVELCGSWLWIGGDTRTHKELLKTLGCKYQAKKQLWYFFVQDENTDNTKPKKRHFHKEKPMDAIRATYGSASLSSKSKKVVTH